MELNKERNAGRCATLDEFQIVGISGVRAVAIGQDRGGMIWFYQDEMSEKLRDDQGTLIFYSSTHSGNDTRTS